MDLTEAGNATGQEPQGVVQCACGMTNPQERRFCTHCGTRLSEPCSLCGQMALVNQRFCGNCGAELAVTAHQQIEQFETDLRNADQRQAEGRFDEALSLLVPISKLTHSLLLRHAHEAKQKIQRITQLRERGIQESAATLEEARRRMAAHDYAGAVKALQIIPVSVRAAEFADLLVQAMACDREVASLVGGLRAAVAGKQFAGLPKILARLLELQPRHAEALSVAKQLQKKYRSSAEEMLNRHHYTQAVKVLEQLPPSLWTAETTELHQRAADRAWLASTLRTANVIGPVLVAAGRRAAELMPGDPGIVKLTGELQRRIKLSEKEDGIAPRPWAAPPAESALGLPLEWNSGFRQIVVAETCDRQALVGGRGCFGVACGLALQGLGLAAIQTDLRPKGKVRVVDIFASLIRRPRSHGVWGIDIGSSSLKAVKLVPGTKQGCPQLEIVLRIEHPKPLGEAANEAEEQALLEETLAALLANHDLRNEYVAVGLPSRIVFNRGFKLPPSDRRKLQAMVEHEVRRHMPVNIEALVWDYATIDSERAAAQRQTALWTGASGARANGRAVNASRALAGRNKSWNVLVTAAQRSHVEKRLAVLQKAELRPCLVQGECTALYNLFAYELGAAGPEPQSQDLPHKNRSVPKSPSAAAKAAVAQAAAADPQAGSDPLAAPIAVVDLGHEGSRLLICSSSSLSAQNLGFGGHLLTRALVREFNLTMAVAEQYKRDPLAAPSVARIYAAAGPVLQDLVRELQLGLAFVPSEEERPPIQKVFILGGSVLFHGLLEFLQSGT